MVGRAERRGVRRACGSHDGVGVGGRGKVLLEEDEGVCVRDND